MGGLSGNKANSASIEIELNWLKLSWIEAELGNFHKKHIPKIIMRSTSVTNCYGMLKYVKAVGFLGTEKWISDF